MNTNEKQARAIRRAEIMGGAGLATEVRPNIYAVTGRQGDLYHVRVAGNQFLCECEAGFNGNPCWHAASVWLRRLAENRLPQAA